MQFTSLLQNEYNIASKLNHENIVKYYEYFVNKDNMGEIKMEFADSGDLFDYIIKDEVNNSILNIFRQIVLGVDHFH